MRYLFIVNPTAGRGDTEEKWEEVKGLIEDIGLDYQVFFTEAPGEAVFLASEGVKSGFDVLVAVGGDGTVNEVIRGIKEVKHAHDVKLGIIPTGTGNDLIRSLEIPKDIREALRIVKKGHTQRIDLGKIDNGYFLNVVGVGFDAAVANEVNTNINFLTGTAAYIYGVFKMIFKYKSHQMKISIDDKVYSGRYFLVAVANGKYFGGGLKIAPQADPSDGYFNICLIREVSQMEVVKVLPSVFNGNHINHPAVNFYKGKRVKIESAEEVLVQADGELKGTLPVTFEIQEKAISILVADK